MIEERDREFPSWRRRDVHKWSRWKFYPGAFLTVFTRFIMVFGSLFWMGILQYFLYLGRTKDVPLTGWRLKVCKLNYLGFAKIQLLMFNYYLETKTHTVDDVDYSKYLGPNWKSQQFKGKRVSTIVGNHCSFLDHWIVMLMPSLKACSPAFTPAAFVKTLPIGHFYVQCIQGYYIDRGGDQKARDEAVRYLGER